ncbi:uncharacterized protein LOC143292303 [Babylonia areolata]|uniref:uncharacterized protein LOC143292303 n=1 Tax=Babylonia areolata TaxID=304850 RepID=UPI003FD2B675
MTKLYNPRTGAFIRDLKPNRHGDLAVMAMRYHPKTIDPGWLFAATAEGNVYVFDTHSAIQEVKPTIAEDKNQINAIDFNSDGYMFGTCGKDLSLRIYDTKSCKLVKEYQGISKERIASNSNTEAGNTKRVFALRFTESEDILLTAGWDNHVKIWDIRTNDGIKRQFHGPHVCGDALDMTGGKILTGSWVANRALQEWDYGEGRLIRDIKFPNEKGAFLYCAQYCDLGVVLAGGSGTNSVEAIEAATDRHIGSVPMTKPVQSLDSVLGGRFFAVGGQDCVLKLCSLH